MKKLILVAVLLAMLFAASACAWGDGGHSTGFTCYYFGECDNL